jgi:hypothetical protein
VDPWDQLLLLHFCEIRQNAGIKISGNTLLWLGVAARTRTTRPIVSVWH